MGCRAMWVASAQRVRVMAIRAAHWAPLLPLLLLGLVVSDIVCAGFARFLCEAHFILVLM